MPAGNTKRKAWLVGNTSTPGPIPQVRTQLLTHLILVGQVVGIERLRRQQPPVRGGQSHPEGTHDFPQDPHMLASFKVVLACQLASNSAFSGLSHHLTAVSHVYASPCSQHGPPPPSLRTGHPRGFVHLLSDLLDGQLDTEADAIQNVLEVGLLVDLELYGDRQCSATSRCRARPFSREP